MFTKRLLIGFAALSLTLLALNFHSIGAVQSSPTGIHAARLTVQVLEKRPHDPTAFTEGFELDHGILYESSGLYGKSNLRAENPLNGQPTRMRDLPQVLLDNGMPIQADQPCESLGLILACQVFGEGIAIDGDQLVQLTWKEHIAFVYNLANFQLLKTFSYDGEGWGMCFDGQDYIMSNGSAALAVRDPKTFALIRTIPVDLDGTPLDQLNEVECVGDSVYANVWMTNNIVKIDKASGHITALIDASGLLTPQENQIVAAGGVLNGIVYDPQANDFIITGKLWPWMFVVRFIPASLSYF